MILVRGTRGEPLFADGSSMKLQATEADELPQAGRTGIGKP